MRGGAILAALCATTPAWAGGFDVPDQDAFVIGRGMAFVATADNASAIYYNPAGISQLQGNNLRLGVYVPNLDVTYKSPSGGSYNNQNPLHAIPQAFYTYTPESFPLSFGLGVYMPFGLSQQWPQDTGFRTVAVEGTLSDYTVNPVVALKLAPNLSIGAGLTVNYGMLDLKQGYVWPAQPYDQFGFRGDGWAAGYNVGVLWKPIEKISLGATFRSSTTYNLQGQTEVWNTTAYPPGYPPQFQVPAFPQQRVDASTRETLPLKVICGLSYRPTPEWNIEFNADYTDWNCVDRLTIQQSGPGAQTFVVPFEWQSSWYYELGVTHYFEKGWLVSAGYIYSENSVPSAYYSPLVSDMDHQFVSVGVGYRGKRFDFDVAYQLGWGARTVSGSAPSATGQTADGKYDFLSNAVAVSVGLHF